MAVSTPGWRTRAGAALVHTSSALVDAAAAVILADAASAARDVAATSVSGGMAWLSSAFFWLAQPSWPARVAMAVVATASASTGNVDSASVAAPSLGVRHAPSTGARIRSCDTRVVVFEGSPECHGNQPHPATSLCGA